jgi:O-antigen/teichoic acid export membrane protein
MKKNRVINNAKWIIVCKIMQSVLQLIVGMLCARYLGPSNYGIINYAASVLAFVLPIMRLGLNETLVHELIKDPDHEGQIMGTALVMNVISSLLCMLTVFGFVSVANRADSVTIIVCVLYSISLFFGALEMIQYWFQYKLESKYPSIVMLVSYVVVSAYRIYLLVTAKSIYWFAVTNSIDYGLIGISLIVIFLLKGQRFSFSFSKMKSMLHVSKNYIAASLMVVVFQSTDHVMLTTMIGVGENGFYSAAITCATIAQFVYVAIVDSFRPVILSNKKENSSDYEKNISRLYCIILYLAVAQSIGFTIFADLVVKLLYGAEYAAAANILRVQCWYFVFACMGFVRNVWILAEQKQKYLWVINLAGALANVLLNLLLIPVLGAIGASLASLATQFFANFVMGYIIKPIRPNNKLLLAGLNPVFFFKEIKTFRKMLRR